MYKYRNALHEDFPIISTFPQSEMELFFMFPRGEYPLNPNQLLEAAEARFLPTVIVSDNEVIGYCNIYDLDEEEKSYWLGNVIISPRFRGQGAGEYLIQVMKERAKSELKVKELYLVCHNTNTRALLFYFKQGFTPFDMKLVNDKSNNPIAGIKMRIELTAQ